VVMSGGVLCVHRPRDRSIVIDLTDLLRPIGAYLPVGLGRATFVKLEDHDICAAIFGMGCEVVISRCIRALFVTTTCRPAPKMSVRRG
jgi:hypothetical protein